MPEGPEIKYLSEICKKYLIGLVLKNIVSNSKTVIKVPYKSKVKNVIFRGKLMILECDDYYFHIHCGLTGWLTFQDPKYPRYEINFTSNDSDLSDKIDKIDKSNDQSLSKTLNVYG